ncbi:crosslink repair DNA glycosylase YcaQ family protein [Salinibacterium sp. G-O1]|uniref:winged helix-turn-helix domain-containing protein n=1 Tax=Salinibacterium sp. G-O1 TaxID=3046208 RepID=UPI0024B87A67|nr:crosslink repair DNA glycosylase YcaQ family protein [Salinibacterium sp. G-O1]MDJ0334418.1 crosslink repair DNA glycosylase YcaQ family protein [Salinibacterium sp. G-O1]
MVESVSAPQARRIALAAQGFGRPATGSVGTRQLNLLIRKLGVLQLDSVNVFERSHYLPVFARLGAYDKALLDTLTFGRRSQYTEAWAHQAAIIPIESWPLWRRAMDARREPSSGWGRWAEANGPMLDFLRAELAEKGPLPAGRIEHDANVRKGPWWGWSDVKTGLECLFMLGEVVAAGRIRFERTYALAEQVLPAEILSRSIPKHDAVRELVRSGTEALGIGTVRDIADYWRLPQALTKVALTELVESGDVLPVSVEGWGSPAFLHKDARIPRRITHTALLSPFDPIVWERARALRMFNFHYRIEIYTPAPKRIFGYYTLPLLVDDAIVGRIDLKTDRQNCVLLVQAAWREAGAAVDLERVAALLRETAVWQGMERIEVAGRGDLSADLAGALTR